MERKFLTPVWLSGLVWHCLVCFHLWLESRVCYQRLTESKIPLHEFWSFAVPEIDCNLMVNYVVACDKYQKSIQNYWKTDGDMVAIVSRSRWSRNCILVDHSGANPHLFGCCFSYLLCITGPSNDENEGWWKILASSNSKIIFQWRLRLMIAAQSAKYQPKDGDNKI